MRNGLIGAGVLALLGCAGAPTTTLVSGVELQYVERTVRPQDDLYRYLNGKWLDSYGSFTLFDDATRVKYLAYTAKMMAVAGGAQAKAHAAEILDLETALAEAQWTRVENRDPIKTYNKIGIADLPRLMPAYDWQRYV
jgi:predicted metalloendopeptidase